MESKLIQAFTGSGNSKTFVADKNVDLPTTVAEAVELWGDVKFVKMARESYTIGIQRELRGGGQSKTSQVNALIGEAKRQKQKGDSGLFDQLVQLEIIKI